MALPTLATVSLYPVDDRGNNIDAGPAGQILPKPLQVALYYTEEGYSVTNCGGGCFYLKGKGIFTTTPVDNATLNYQISSGEGQVNPAQRVNGPSGIYDTILTLGPAPARNIVLVSGVVTKKIPTVDSGGTLGQIDRDFSVATNFEVWGVRASVKPDRLLLINDGGYPADDAPVPYLVEPADYPSRDLYLAFYENDHWMGYVPGDPRQSLKQIILNQGGARFSPDKLYDAELILNWGSQAEIRSEKTHLPIGRVQLLSDDPTPEPMIGAVTDGETKLRLRLTVKQGREFLPSQMDWKIADPEVLNSTDMGDLLKGNQPVATTLVVFDNVTGVAETVYRVPKTFVRFGASPEIQANDQANRVERIIQVKLNELTIGVPQIRLKRPPVILVHGIWASGDSSDLDYSWAIFEPGLNIEKQFDIYLADYQKTSAHYFSVNSPFVQIWLGDARRLLTKQQFAVSKVDVVAHSMGGMLVRMYCLDHELVCKEQIHKFITLDSPHTGTEVANEAVKAVNMLQTQGKPQSELERDCRNLVLTLHSRTPKRALDEGAPVDAAVGSATMQMLAFTKIIVPTRALSGNLLKGTSQGRFAMEKDKELDRLWHGLEYFCMKVPNSSFVPTGSSSDETPLFPEGGDDRFIPVISQQGGLTGSGLTPAFEGVDHVTVHGTKSVIDEVKWLLDVPATEQNFQMTGFWGNR